MSYWTPEPEPMSLPVSQALADFHLWRDAPAWRNLVLSAIALTAALLALPMADASSDGAAKDRANTDISTCHANATTFAGASGRGEVVGFLSTDQALRLMQSTQFTSRIAIDPDYVANLRSLVHLDGSIEGSRFVYLVPKDMTVQIGNRVEVAGGHLDPSVPCHYVPNLITRLEPK